MRNGFVCKQNFTGGDYFGDTCFIVSAEQCCAVCDDECFADVIFENRIFTLAHDDVKLIIQNNVSAVIFDGMCTDVFILNLGRNIHVCDKADHGCILISPHRRHGCEKVTVFIECHLVKPKLTKLGFKCFCKFELCWC